MKQVAVTFDFDFIKQNGAKKERDELEEFWPLFLELLQRFPEIKTTWFIRIDEHIAHFFGEADYFFKKHYQKIEWLRQNEHEVGWHFHSFTKTDKGFTGNSNENLLEEELKRTYETAKKYQINILRMGFGFHSNRTLKAVADLGMAYDSSALPGIKQNAGKTNADWSVTSQTPYFPSIEDYRVSGKKNLNVLEIPLTTVEYEDPKNRAWKVHYLNPAYPQSVFEKLVKKASGNSINTLTHPHEIIDGSKTNKLIQSGIENFSKNLKFLEHQQYVFTTLTKLSTANK